MAATPNPPICSTTMSILSAHLEIQQHGEIKRDAIGITNGMHLRGKWSNANRVPTGHNAYDSMSCHLLLHKIQQCPALRCQLYELIWKYGSMGNQTGCNGDNQSQTNGMHVCGMWSNAGRVLNWPLCMTWHEPPLVGTSNPPIPSTTVSIVRAHLEIWQHGVSDGMQWG